MMRYLIGLLCIMVAFIGCVPEQDGNSADPGEPDVAIDNIADNADSDGSRTASVIFLTGNTLGQLKPCGCAEGQLGGFSRRQVIFNEADPDSRLLIDTGNFVKSDGDQDMLKLDSIIQSLTVLGYDVVNFNESDTRIAGEMYSFDQAPFKTISTDGDDRYFTKEIETGKGIMQVNVASLKSESLDEAELKKYFTPEGLSLNILICDLCDDSIKDYLGRLDLVDVVVCPSASDEPRIIKSENAKPLFVSVGNLGKYVGRLAVEVSDNNKLQLAYSSVAVDEKLPASEALENIFENYKEMVKMEDILGKVTRVSLPDNLKYAGSDKCKICHNYEYEKWSEQKHAHAYKTLVDDNSQYDPECIECHVVGLKYESGFQDENSPKGLRNVGCEVCHGPRSEHIKNALNSTEEAGKFEPQPAFQCISCHTPEHSPGYEEDPEGYHKKIIHW